MEHMQTYLRKEVLDVIKKQEGKLEFLEKEQDLLQSTVDTHVKKQLSKLSDDMQDMKKELGSDLQEKLKQVQVLDQKLEEATAELTTKIEEVVESVSTLEFQVNENEYNQNDNYTSLSHEVVISRLLNSLVG